MSSSVRQDELQGGGCGWVCGAAYAACMRPAPRPPRATFVNLVPGQGPLRRRPGQSSGTAACPPSSSGHRNMNLPDARKGQAAREKGVFRGVRFAGGREALR